MRWILLTSLINFVLLTGPLKAAESTLEADEAAIIANTKALHDEQGSVREAAAAALRDIVAKYPSGTSNIRDRDSGEAYWMKKVQQVTPGMTEAEVLKILPPFKETPELSTHGSGDSHVTTFRLDPHWTVTIQYRNPDKVIERPKLSKRELLIYVKPPADYSGTWTCWYVNGSKGHKVQYENGKYDGTLTAYYDSGAKCYEQHYRNHVADGPDTGWYKDGAKMYSGQYRADKQDGRWIHWYENGQKSSESNFKNGEQDGLYASWYENGQVRFEMNYRNGVKHGKEAAWSEKGELQYKHEYKVGGIVD